MRGSALAFVTSLGVAVLAPTALVADGPVVQSTDTLGTPGQPVLVSLSSTELGVTESGSRPAFELEGTIRALPCGKRDYRFVATTSFIDSARASVSEAEVRITAARLPRGVHCGSSVVAVGARVLIQRLGTTVIRTRYQDGEAELESLSECATLQSLCSGRYVLSASVTTPAGRRLGFGYLFEVLPLRRGTTTKRVQCPRS